MEDETLFRFFECPQDIRLVAFKSMVFKVKCCFRMSSREIEERPFQLNAALQNETKKVLLVYLCSLSESRVLRPIHSTNIVVYPFLNPWQAQAILDFYKGGTKLNPFKKSLTLYVELKNTSPLENSCRSKHPMSSPQIGDVATGLLSKRQCSSSTTRLCTTAKRPCTTASLSADEQEWNEEIPALPSEQATVSTGSTSVDLQSDDSGVCCFTDDTPEQLVSTGSEPWFYQKIWHKLKAFVGLK